MSEPIPSPHENTEAIFKKVEEFVKVEFEKHPHFSFDDWTVMYKHSKNVRDRALEIAEGMPVDRTVLTIAALLQHIGKTYEADAATLHAESENFNVPVARGLLDSLPLTDDQRHRIEMLLQHKSDSDEMRIIEDADAVAFYTNERLTMLFYAWAKKNELDLAIKRKVDKFAKLHFQKSRELGRVGFEKMKADWNYKDDTLA